MDWKRLHPSDCDWKPKDQVHSTNSLNDHVDSVMRIWTKPVLSEKRQRAERKYNRGCLWKQLKEDKSLRKRNKILVKSFDPYIQLYLQPECFRNFVLCDSGLRQVFYLTTCCINGLNRCPTITFIFLLLKWQHWKNENALPYPMQMVRTTTRINLVGFLQ